MLKLPPLAPPYTGGETDARSRSNVTMQRILPLCKGELEGVVKALALCGWNLKSLNLKLLRSSSVNPSDLRTNRIQLFINMLVTAVNLIDVINDTCPLRRQRRDQQGNSRTYIRRSHLGGP